MIKLVPEIRHFFRPSFSFISVCWSLKAKNEIANQKRIVYTSFFEIRIIVFSNNKKFCLKVHINTQEKSVCTNYVTWAYLIHCYLIE